MNEKRKVEEDLDADSPAGRTRSDVAPKLSGQSGAPARHISGMRPAFQAPRMPTVPPAPLTPEDLLEDGWDDEDDDSGPTLLDSHGSVPPELVAEARAASDPLGETAENEDETNEVRTREVATREVPTNAFSRDEAPTNRLILPPDAVTPLAPAAPADTGASESEDDEEFSHDDFPTRQTPMGLQAALLSFQPPSDSHRGLHETLTAADESLPDLPSSVALAAPPVSPLAPRISADDTAQMPLAPPLPRSEEPSQPPPPAERSSVSKISQVSQVSQISYPSQTPHPSQVSQASHAMRPLMYPTPTSITGAPLPPAHSVRFAFLRNLSPNNDPPLNRLALVALLSFGATLLVSAFVAWIIVLARH